MARMGHDSMQAAIIYQHASREADRSIAAHLNTQLKRLESGGKKTKKKGVKATKSKAVRAIEGKPAADDQPVAGPGGTPKAAGHLEDRGEEDGAAGILVGVD
jgi:hypothetical protein